ncbi:MAG: O-antigen ligase family protein [Candidatus Pacebacteria bacterium]|jgi:O-antigen ligase|nr:O-antigen ligase family protein [Candidatus Paceibacterota bacterium]
MNIHKFLANAVVLAGFVAIPFIAFIILGQSTFFPFITGKNFAFRVIVEIMLSAWVVLAFIDPAYRPKKSYLLGAFAALIGIITLSAIFGENPAKSFWSNFERMEGVVTYFHLFAYFIVASTVLSVRDLWKPYLNLHLGAGVIMAIYGVLQWAGQVKVVQDGIRINGTLGNAEYLSTYALFNIFLALYMLVRENFETTSGNVRAAIYAVIVVLQTFVLYHSGTRGAMLGLLAGVGLTTLLIAIFEKERKTIRNVAIGALVALGLLVGGFIAARDTAIVQGSPVLSRLAAISPSEGTGKARLMVWGMAYEGFKEKPILGWGMDNFGYVFNKYYDPNMWGQEQWFDRAHNVFFDWLIAGGILGLLAYLSLFGGALFYIWRRQSGLSVVEKSVLTGLLGGYFFQNLFVFDNITSLVLLGTILAYVESFGKTETLPVVENKKINKSEDAEDLTFMISGGAFILAIVLIYIVNYKGFMQNTTLLRALSERTSEGIAHNLNLFKEVLAYNSFGTAEAREQLGSIAMNGLDRSKEITEVQKQFIILASDELEKQVAEVPGEARHQVFAGSFIARTGDIDKAIGYLEKAAELSPTKQAILFELGNVYYNKKEPIKAEETFKRAYELAPEFATAEKYYLQVLLLNGKRAEAEKLFKERPIQGVSL